MLNTTLLGATKPWSHWCMIGRKYMNLEPYKTIGTFLCFSDCSWGIKFSNTNMIFNSQKQKELWLLCSQMNFFYIKRLTKDNMNKENKGHIWLVNSGLQKLHGSYKWLPLIRKNQTIINNQLRFYRNTVLSEGYKWISLPYQFYDHLYCAFLFIFKYRKASNYIIVVTFTNCMLLKNKDKYEEWTHRVALKSNMREAYKNKVDLLACTNKSNTSNWSVRIKSKETCFMLQSQLKCFKVDHFSMLLNYLRKSMLFHNCLQ